MLLHEKDAPPSPSWIQAQKYPTTRFMGSKNKLLKNLSSVAADFDFDEVYDLFSGSGVVGYMFKAQGKRVLSNDYMCMSSTYARALIENSTHTLTDGDIEKLMNYPGGGDGFVANTFRGLYYVDEDNAFIDKMRASIASLRNPAKRALAMTALIRACVKKRPRGIFTYVGNRYDDGRRDLSLTLREHFLEAACVVNNAVFDNGQYNRSRWGDALTIRPPRDALVYIDPPYYSSRSDNEYVRRYHFVEGLARNWEGVEIQHHTITKKFKSYPTPFSTEAGSTRALETLFRRFKHNILMVSYSSNSLPTMQTIVEMLQRYKPHVEVLPVDYTYSFGNQGHIYQTAKTRVKEYIFVAH